jgi:hypothetical protein
MSSRISFEQVENTLFKVPRYLFEQSSDIFRDMFLLPLTDDLVPDGSSDEQPLRLEAIRQADFQRLLKAMKFPPSPSITPSDPLFREPKSKQRRLPSKDAYDELMIWSDWASVLELSCMWQMPMIQAEAIRNILGFDVNSAEWKSLLKLSTKLEVTEIRDRAIENLSGVLQPVEMIEVGIDCAVRSLLFAGYKRLVEGQGGISEEDEKRLGHKTTSRLFRMRDQFLQDKYYSIRAPWIFIKEEIEKVFAEELREVGICK